MSKLFSEHDFQEIAKIWDCYNPEISVNFTVDYLLQMGWDMNNQEALQIALALGNPISRELVKSVYVTKEKKFYWKKEVNTSQKSSVTFYLTTHSGATQVNLSSSTRDKLTESEIINWGYNPALFIKED